MLAEPSERREDNRNTIVSFDYRACFILGNAIDPLALAASLSSFCLARDPMNSSVASSGEADFPQRTNGCVAICSVARQSRSISQKGGQNP